MLFPDGLPEDVRYLVYQIEKGEEGTEHVQGYIQFTKNKRMAAIKKITFNNTEGTAVLPFARSHLAVAKGSPEQNKAYCTKAEGRIAGPWELGTSITSGQRVDLDAAYKIVLETGDISKVEPAVFMKYASSCMKLASLAQPPRRDGLKVICIVGATGIGKSYATHECYPNLYMPFYGNSGLWWDGYTGQEVVLLEEFRGQVPLQKMLQILDPYPLRLEIKGGSVPARHKLVIITSNTHPSEWYPDNPQKPGATREPERKALNRRLGVGTTRYIEADTRIELQTKLAIALRLDGVVPPVPQPWLPAPLMQAAPAGAVAAPAGAVAASPPITSVPNIALAKSTQSEHSECCTGLLLKNGEYIICTHHDHSLDDEQVPTRPNSPMIVSSDDEAPPLKRSSNHI